MQTDGLAVIQRNDNVVWDR